jgi:hypothetical protein
MLSKSAKLGNNPSNIVIGNIQTTTQGLFMKPISYKAPNVWSE